MIVSLPTASLDLLVRNLLEFSIYAQGKIEGILIRAWEEITEAINFKYYIFKLVLRLIC
jgi:hypothetical protein